MLETIGKVHFETAVIGGWHRKSNNVWWLWGDYKLAEEYIEWCGWHTTLKKITNNCI